MKTVQIFLKIISFLLFSGDNCITPVNLEFGMHAVRSRREFFFLVGTIKTSNFLNETMICFRSQAIITLSSTYSNRVNQPV